MGRMTVDELEDELVTACTRLAMAEARYARAERGGGATADDFAELREADTAASDAAVELCRAIYGPRAYAYVSRTLDWGMGVSATMRGLAAEAPGTAEHERLMEELCDGLCVSRGEAAARVAAMA